MEVWSIVPNTDNKYEISTLGNVRRIGSSAILKHWANKSGHLRIALGGYGKFYIHRLVAIAFVSNPDNKPCVDHIDGNSSNNNADNLRWATVSENLHNAKKPYNNTSGYKGVRFSCGRFNASIKINGKALHLGRFDTAEEAHRAYMSKSIELFGGFARSS